MSIGGCIGILLHTLFKMIKIKRGMKKKGVVIKFKQVAAEYRDSDADTLLLGIVFYAFLLFVASEFIDLHHLDTIDYSIPIRERLEHYSFSQFIKLSSVIAGFTSSSMSYSIIGTADDKIRDKVTSIITEQKTTEVDISNNKN